MQTRNSSNEWVIDGKVALKGALLLSLTGVLAMVALAVLPSFVGVVPMVVSSPSMEPVMSPGDVVLVRTVRNPRFFSVGDVVTFRSGTALVTHRVVNLKPTASGAIVYQTKGDANLTADPNLLPTPAVVGKAILVIPRIGYVTEAVGSLMGRSLLLVTPAVLLATMWLYGRNQRQQGAARGGGHAG